MTPWRGWLAVCLVSGFSACGWASPPPPDNLTLCAERIRHILRTPTPFPRPGFPLPPPACRAYADTAAAYLCGPLPCPGRLACPAQAPMHGPQVALQLKTWDAPSTFPSAVIRAAHATALEDHYVFFTFVHLDPAREHSPKWTARPSVVLRYAERSVRSYIAVHWQRLPMVVANDQHTYDTLARKGLGTNGSLVLDTTALWRDPLLVDGMKYPVNRVINQRYFIILLLISRGFVATFFDVDSEWARPFELPLDAVTHGADVVLSSQVLDGQWEGKPLRQPPRPIPNTSHAYAPLEPRSAYANRMVRYCPLHPDNLAINAGFQTWCPTERAARLLGNLLALLRAAPTTWLEQEALSYLLDLHTLHGLRLAMWRTRAVVHFASGRCGLAWLHTKGPRALPRCNPQAFTAFAVPRDRQSFFLNVTVPPVS